MKTYCWWCGEEGHVGKNCSADLPEAFPQRHKLTRRMRKLHSGYGGNHNLAEQARFGRIIIEYILESDHQSWEGFTSDQVLAIDALLADINICIELGLTGE